MRIVFAGTPDYAVPSLKALAALAPAHEVVAVVTQPDRAKGRSATPTPPPVKAAALALGIKPERIIQRSINKPEALEFLRGLAPDLLCVVAYGGLLKKDALELAKLFPLNAHGSILPQHRGAAPIQAALLAGDAQTGVCIMKMEAGLDTGPVLLERAIPILPTDTAGTLHDKLAELSAACFVEALKLPDLAGATFTPQDHAHATYAGKLSKDTGRVDWSKDAVFLERFVRAMSPWPGAWTSIALPDGKNSKRLRIAKAALPPGTPRAASLTRVISLADVQKMQSTAGQAAADSATESRAAELAPPAAVRVVSVANAPREDGAARFEVECGQGALQLLRVQAEGGREMSVDEFLRGQGRLYANGARVE